VQIEARAAGHHQLKAVLRLADAHRGYTVVSLLRMADSSTSLPRQVCATECSASGRAGGSRARHHHHSAIEDIFNDRWEYMGTSTPQGYALDLSSSLGHDFPPSAR
jgi:hypothetical protein